MRDLTEALKTLAVDERFLEMARSAFAWHSVDVDLELAQMFYDSYLDEGVLVRGAGSGSHRTLAFQGEHLGVEIELSDTGIEGQLIPAQPGEVTLMTPKGSHARATADEIGCFAFPPPPPGPVRLECSTDGGRFTTEWVTV
jgi:hypothetical protein